MVKFYVMITYLFVELSDIVNIVSDQLYDRL